MQIGRPYHVCRLVAVTWCQAVMNLDDPVQWCQRLQVCMQWTCIAGEGDLTGDVGKN